MRTTTMRLFGAGALSAALVMGSVAPALAEPVGAGDSPIDSAPALLGADPSAGRTPAASSRLDEPSLVLGDSGGQRIMIDKTERPVAPGLELSSFQWLDAAGFLRGDALVADLGTQGLSGDYLFPGEVAKGEALSQQAEREHAVAAVNGDFFDINNSTAPLGVGLSKDGMVKGPVPGWNHAVGIDAQGIGRMTEMFLEGSVSMPGPRTARLDGLNQHQLPPGGIGAYTSLWGSYTRAPATAGASRVREVTVVDGKVTTVATEAGSGAIAENSLVLVGLDAGADALEPLRVGDAVSLNYAPRSDDGQMSFAVGGNTVLLRDGVVQPQDDQAVHPRTSVGFSADGRKMFLVTIDGRTRESRGMTYQELGAFMKELGADDALNLDGGGSSTLVAREAGEPGVDVENDPSDGAERPVPNGLALFAAQGSGRLTGMRVVPAADEEDESLSRVFPGLTRKLAALGYDETYAPVAADPHWQVQPATVGQIGKDGTFTAANSGDAEVIANDHQASGKLLVTVLGPLARTRADIDKVVLANPQATGTFGIVGYDRDGFQAPIDPADVELDYDRSQLDITPTAEGTFQVRAKADRVGSVVTATVRGVVTHVPVSVGLDDVVVADFADAAQWKFGTARGSGSVEPATGRDGGPALKLSYDFTQSTATRTAYATAPAPIQLPGQPLSVGAWVYGEGKGEWTAFTIVDAEGTSQSLYGPYITWTGWQYVEVPIPQTVAFPVTVTRFYTIETSATRQYTGSVLVDDITAKVAPQVAVPASPRVEDPVVVQDGSVAGDDRRWRFAVVSDAQFIAADPNSPLVEAARRTLREAVAANPDFIVINGDWVDTGYPEDLALAHRVIDEEIGDKVPWYYNPGNHEVYGSGNQANFRAEFGETHRSFDHNGTRFVLLDSSLGTLGGGGFDQWTMLRGALDGAAKDANINGVVAMWHHPPRDPSPLQNSQLTDRTEAEVVEQWLADFRRDTGKGAAFIGGHVGSFSANSVDGVPYIVNGNAGKTPSTLPTDGGFNGWSLVGIDPNGERAPEADRHRTAPESRSERPWLRVEFRPHVDGLALDPIGELRTGTTTTVHATVTQHGTAVPVAYPVSADWSGAQGVHVGPVEQADPLDIASYDPRTGVLTALRSGSGALTVTVNGATTTVPVNVKAA
ncbi:phosphodiester glycosidase family protein [Saccharopolyspora sp. K220]|uniref:phosphodiester glycosidase family protein n=1 Tax=Saccharopolyspora soli TaxID=2926618 RepID=UPI001F5A11FD|nr:phosphodiester glycosidase family protein [Saccharopolyspora soli]MCI2417431.1 phosphodiester glycosidase family protein [Saccharopolyspora soli]